MPILLNYISKQESSTSFGFPKIFLEKRLKITGSKEAPYKKVCINLEKIYKFIALKKFYTVLLYCRGLCGRY